MNRRILNKAQAKVAVVWWSRNEERKLTKYAASETDSASPEWRKLDQESRISKIEAVLENTEFKDSFAVTRATESGAVYVTMTQPLGPSVRGAKLLDLEEFLKEKIDRGLNIWCEPIGDRNSLRNLRGVQIIN